MGMLRSVHAYDDGARLRFPGAVMRSEVAFAAAVVGVALAHAASAAHDEAVVPEQQVPSIRVPASASLGAAAAGGTVSGRLGTLRVSDTRGAQARNWTASVTPTDFTSGANTSPGSAVRYWSGPATATSGAGPSGPGQSNATNAVRLDAQRTAFTRSHATENNTSAWAPSLVIHVRPRQRSAPHRPATPPRPPTPAGSAPTPPAKPDRSPSATTGN